MSELKGRLDRELLMFYCECRLSYNFGIVISNPPPRVRDTKDALHTDY